jgi:hypothetical protein
LIAENLRIREDQVIRVEREGIENNWPPLSGDDIFLGGAPARPNPKEHLLE